MKWINVAENGGMEDRGWLRALNEITSGKLLAQRLAHSEKGRRSASASLPCIVSGSEFPDWVPSLIGVSLMESGVASSQAWKEEVSLGGWERGE